MTITLTLIDNERHLGCTCPAGGPWEIEYLGELEFSAWSFQHDPCCSHAPMTCWTEMMEIDAPQVPMMFRLAVEFDVLRSHHEGGVLVIDEVKLR